jgi:ABC-2 type transport system permease protein
MNGHLWQVFLYELQRNIRRRGFLFTTFGVPLIGFLLFFGYQAITEANNRNRNPTEDAAKLAQSDQFRQITRAGYIDESGLFPTPGEGDQIFTRYDSEAEARAALDKGEIQVYYIIPADYMQTGDVTLYMPKFSLTQASNGPIQRVILSNLAKGIDRDLFNRLQNPANIQEVNLQRDASGNTSSNFGSDFAVVYVFAIILMMSVFLTNGYLMRGVIEEKETRLIEIFISTMRPTDLLAGKILALGLLGLLQMVVWLGALVLLGRFALSSNLPQVSALTSFALPPDRLIVFLLYFIFGYLFFAAAYGIVGALSNSMQEGPQYAVIFTLPAVIPLYFSSLFTTTPDAALPTILSIFPVTAPLGMVMRIAITTVPFWQIALSLGLLIVLDVVMIWIAGRMFRVTTLLAGQVPKLRDLPRLLRG